MSSIANRYDFAFLFDVHNGNPNGDPDAGNMPRQDAETGRGIVTDVAIKRRIRNYVALTRGDTPGHGIYVRDGGTLNAEHRKAYVAAGLEPELKKLPKDEAKARAITRWMTDNYFDIRSFGAVMGTEINAGQVRGPVQFTFAESIDPVVPTNFTLTRCAVTKEGEDKTKTMGNKWLVPYGLYRAHGHISALLASDAKKGTGFSDEDLSLLFEALMNMYDHDRSSSKGEMTARSLVVFRHDSALGNAPAHKLLERVTVSRVTDGPARSIKDYSIAVDRTGLPDGVTVTEMI